MEKEPLSMVLLLSFSFFWQTWRCAQAWTSEQEERRAQDLWKTTDLRTGTHETVLWLSLWQHWQHLQEGDCWVCAERSIEQRLLCLLQRRKLSQGERSFSPHCVVVQRSVSIQPTRVHAWPSRSQFTILQFHTLSWQWRNTLKFCGIVCCCLPSSFFESRAFPRLGTTKASYWADRVSSSLCTRFNFVLRKKGSKTKKRMKEEEIEKGYCGPPTRKVFFWDFVGLEPSGTKITSQTRVKRVSRIHHRTILLEDAFDSRLRGD